MSGYIRGIDVSEHNGVIDWEKVKASGIRFAMLRGGYGQTLDKQFKRNASECNRLGIPCGVYWFSYALEAYGAEREAARCLEAIQPYQIDYPIAFDLEYDSVKYAQNKGVYIGMELASDMARVFCRAIQGSGYTAINYANPDYLNRYFDEQVKTEFPVWLAQWPSGTPNLEKPPRTCEIWQYSEKGTIPGIKGSVDLDICYGIYPKQKKEEEEDNMKYYKSISDIPAYYKEAVDKTIQKGGLKGTGDGVLNISEDVCRVLTILDRMGKLD